MSLLDKFEVVGGTITGRLHMLGNRHNDDAFVISATPEFIVGVVSDGCGDALDSSLGASIGSKLIANRIIHRLLRHGVPIAKNEGIGMAARFSQKLQVWLEDCNIDILTYSRIIADCLYLTTREKFIENHFLYTAIGFIVTDTFYATFAIGDGMIAVNGDVKTLGPFPSNRPPYVCYPLLKVDFPEGQLTLKLRNIGFTSDLQSIMIGSDGLTEFPALSNKTHPGTSDKVGDVSQFWTDDRYFNNSDAIRRKLFQMNRYDKLVDFSKGEVNILSPLLTDDTTMVVLRKKP